MYHAMHLRRELLEPDGSCQPCRPSTDNADVELQDLVPTLYDPQLILVPVEAMGPDAERRPADVPVSLPRAVVVAAEGAEGPRHHDQLLRRDVRARIGYGVEHPSHRGTG